MKTLTRSLLRAFGRDKDAGGGLYIPVLNDNLCMTVGLARVNAPVSIDEGPDRFPVQGGV